MSSNALLEHRQDRLEDAMIRLSEEMLKFKNEMAEFKNEMAEFKNEMAEFKEEMREENKKTNKRLGEISNKQGKIIEDLIYPATRPLISKYYNIPAEDIDTYSNVHKKSKAGEREEFDIIALIPSYVFLIEVKSTMRDNYISDYLEKLKRFPSFFPEYSDRKLIPVMASLTMDKHFVELLTKNNILAMAYKEWEYMDFLNFGN